MIKMLINCDIGERGVAHPVDDQLMQYVDIANIACGGHAGDEQSIRHYLKLALENGVTVTAHLSYPDRANFGRKVMDISDEALLASLHEQHQRIGKISRVKLHGALYNELNANTRLAKVIAEWFKQQGVTEVLTPHNSALALACESEGITTVFEAFLDRRYHYSEGRLALVPRGTPGAVIESVQEAKEQFSQFEQGYIRIEQTNHTLKVQTLCIHSDSDQSLAMLQALRDV